MPLKINKNHESQTVFNGTSGYLNGRTNVHTPRPVADHTPLHVADFIAVK